MCAYGASALLDLYHDGWTASVGDIRGGGGGAVLRGRPADRNVPSGQRTARHGQQVLRFLRSLHADRLARVAALPRKSDPSAGGEVAAGRRPIHQRSPYQQHQH